MLTRIFPGIVLFVPLAAFVSDPTLHPANRGAVAVGPECDTTHVYVAPESFDALVNSFVATFGGSALKRSTANVIPVSSSTELQAC